VNNVRQQYSAPEMKLPIAVTWRGAQEEERRAVFGRVVAPDIDGAALRSGGGLPPLTQPLRNSPPSC
jgi:hypothetical protein